jgi:hypothetical protein
VTQLDYRRLIAPALVGTFVALALNTCSPASESDTASSGSAPAPGSIPASDPESGGGLEAIPATTDIGVGPNRFAFLLLTPSALVNVPEVPITSYRITADGSLLSDSVQTTTAGFHLWPYGTRGTYVAELSFDTEGNWIVETMVEDAELGGLSVQIPVRVATTTLTPAVGTSAPSTSNKTIGTVERLSQLTTGSTVDPALYQVTVDEAISNGLPTLLAFASPALCTSPTCGPQVETVSQIAAAHGDTANFIHIEVYDNPDEIQGDLSRARYSQSVLDWGINQADGYQNESWVFLLEPGGRIAARFEGYASAAELEAALISLQSAN